MPKKKLPKPFNSAGVSQFDRSPKDANRYPYLDKYTPEIFDELCNSHRINGAELRERFRHVLEHRVIAYFSAKRARDQKAKPSQIRTQLSDIKKTIKQLIKQLKEFHPDSNLWVRKMESEIYFPNYPHIDALKSSGAVKVGIDENGNEVREFHVPSNLLEELSLFLHTIEGAQPRIPRGDGRPLNLPLFEWVAGMASFWRTGLGREFTIDSHKGEGTTASYAFLRDCLSPLATEQIRYLPAMMKRVKQDH